MNTQYAVVEFIIMYYPKTRKLCSFCNYII